MQNQLAAKLSCTQSQSSLFKQQQNRLTIVDGNAILSLEQIEVQNASDWSEVRLSDFKLRVGNRLDRVLSHDSMASVSRKGSDFT